MRHKEERQQFKQEMSDCLEVVESLSTKEKNKILSVLQKDENLRKGQEKKISILKREIQEIRMKGVLRPGDDQDKMCRRCRAEFGFFFNRGDLCPVCRFKVCKNCQEFMFNGSWICIFCYKQRQLKWMTGEWASFQQNPLRKWASGSDILRASFQLTPGPSIDIDEPQQNGSGSRGRKTARNGVAGSDPNRSRVEAPQDGDQHKLSQLFDVLRSKKPDQPSQETEIRRISSRRYHESDSESSSSSDLENLSGHSSPNALSVTESEKDAQVGESSREVESPRLSQGAVSPKSDSSRNSGSSERIKQRPIPSPRSPKPAPRKKHSDMPDSDKIVVDPDRVVRPKIRQERKSEINLNENTSRLSVDETSRVSMSRSVDTNLGDSNRQYIDNDRRAVSNAELNLQKHVNRTKESLERKQEEFKSESKTTGESESQMKKSKDKKHRRSADDLLENNRSSRDRNEKLRKSDSGNRLDDQSGGVVEEAIVAVRKSKDNESAILMKDSPTLDRRKPKDSRHKADLDLDIPDGSKECIQTQDDDLHIQIPRGGSPYSISMDSLPSSHPSPTFRRGSSIGGSSHADSSDTDSISRMSHPELGEYSGTESAQHGHDDDFVVEEISKIRFQRVSKKVGQMGVVSKLTKSPRTDCAVGVEIGERGTQEALTNVRNNEEGGRSQASPSALPNKSEYLETKSHVTPSQSSYKARIDNKNDPEVVQENIPSLKLSKPKSSFVFPTKIRDSKIDSSDGLSDAPEVFEDDVVAMKVVKQESTLELYVNESVNDSQQESRNRTVEELSWYNDMDHPADWYKKHVHLKPNPRHSSVKSNLERMPSEADSIEGMIDEMVAEGKLRHAEYSRQASGVESSDGDASYCVTPISPLPPEMYEKNKTGTYRLAYISDDNVLDGESGDDELDDKGYNKQKMISMGSLDLLLYNQGDMASTDDLALDYEVQEALKTRSTNSGKSNSSSLDSLQDVVDKELSMENSKDDMNKEFTSTVASLQNLSAVCNEDPVENPDIKNRKKQKKGIKEKYNEDKSDTQTHSIDHTDAPRKSEGAIDIPQVKKTPLSAKNSLDALIDSQQDFIENPNENIELEKHFDFLHKEKNDAPSSDDIDGILKNDNIVKEVPMSKATEKVEEGIMIQDKCDKGKLQTESSLDVLINNQGDMIDTSVEQVELSAEFIEALEQEFNGKRRVSNEEFDIHSDFSYLGIQQNIAGTANKNTLYHYGTVDDDTETEQEGLKTVFGENEVTEPTQLAIRTIKSMPIGYLGQKDSEETSDSDALSVIEEEDEAESPSDCQKGEPEKHPTEVDTMNDSELDVSKSQVIKQQELFEQKLLAFKTGNSDLSKTEEKTHVKGKIYTKARDMESKVKSMTGSQPVSNIEGKTQMKFSSKLHDKFKRLHDHWVAIEHHEADILDLDDEDENDVNDVNNITKKDPEIDTNSDFPNVVSDEELSPNKAKVLKQVIVSDDEKDIVENKKSENIDSLVPLQEASFDKDQSDGHIKTEKEESQLLIEDQTGEKEIQTNKADDFDFDIDSVVENNNDVTKKENIETDRDNLDTFEENNNLQGTCEELDAPESMSSIEDIDLVIPSRIEKNESRLVVENIESMLDKFSDKEVDKENTELENNSATATYSDNGSQINIDINNGANIGIDIGEGNDNTESTSISDQNIVKTTKDHILGMNESEEVKMEEIEAVESSTVKSVPSYTRIGNIQFENSPYTIVNLHDSNNAPNNKDGDTQVINHRAEETYPSVSVQKELLRVCRSISDGESDVIDGSYSGIDVTVEKNDKENGASANQQTEDVSDAHLNTPEIEEIKNEEITSCESMTVNSVPKYSEVENKQVEHSNNTTLVRHGTFTVAKNKDNLTQVTNNDTQEIPSDDIVEKRKVTVCRSISDGESELVYRVREDSDLCHSIDETTLIELDKDAGSFFVIESDVNKSELVNVNTNTEGEKVDTDREIERKVDAINSESHGSDDVFKNDVMDSVNTKSFTTEIKHIPLKRLSEGTKNLDEKLNLESPTSSRLFSTTIEIDLTKGDDSIQVDPPHLSDNSNMIKVPGDSQSLVRVIPLSSSTQSSPDMSTSSSLEEKGDNQSEKLAGFHESPMTISECSVSQDDSGNVSGGSRGATPEHRRTDSGYSQSSIPSTLSTVTDRSEEEEDIDKVIANIHSKGGSRGNLLSVFSDSRESIASYYSDAGDIAYNTVPVTGEILFSINYNYKTVMLEIGVKQCKDIAVADAKRNRSDPYVKTYLLPDRTRSGKRKTKIKKHTVNPTFDETLKYSISKSELENRTLWVTLWHSDRFGRNIFLGEVTINFDYFKFNDPSPRWYQLQERMDSQPSSMMVYKGDLSLCIRYVPADKVTTPTHSKGKSKKESSSKGQLEVKVKEARNLTAVRSNGFSDPFCKGYLLPEKNKSGKQKTSVIKKDCNPVWDHTFVFEDVALTELRDRCLELTIWDYEKLSSNDFLGGVRLNLGTVGANDGLYTLKELRDRCLELTIWDYEKLSSNDFLGGVRLNLGTGLSQGKPVDWMDARGEEMSIWQAMLDRPNVWIDGALILRPNMEKRKF